MEILHINYLNKKSGLLGLTGFSDGRDVENAAKKYEAESKEAGISFQNAKKQVELLDAPLDETQKLLEALYAKDIIFEKYRNLVAISTIYECI